MGRKKKEAFDFFPLYCDFFENDKIKKLRRSHGAVGLITYLNILCRIYSGGGYYYKCSSVEELAEDIAEQICSNKDRTASVASRCLLVIRYLAEQGMFEKTLLERSVITGRSVQEQYIEMSQKSKRLAEIGIYSLVDVNVSVPEKNISSEEMGISSEEMAISSEESAQSKSKSKSKRNTTTIHTPTGGVSVLSDDDMKHLASSGIPSDYIEMYIEKVRKNGYRSQNHARSVMEWWRKDRDRWERRNRPKAETSSFDTDDFFAAALQNVYGDVAKKTGES